MDIDYLVQSLNHVENKAGLVDYLTELTKAMKLKHFWYMIIPRDLARLNHKSLYHTAINNYPKEFEHGYINDQRYLYCPVLHHAYHQIPYPASWDELFDGSKISELQIAQVEWFATQGVTNGISCPIHGANGEFSILHFVLNKEDDPCSEEVIAIKNKLVTLTNFIDVKAKNILVKSHLSCDNIKLTPRETDCIMWAARGKTSWETATILKLSEHTVREYLKNCLTKLNASTKAEAISKAILIGFISYSDIFLSTAD